MQTPSLVVLDGHTLNPGDLSWDALRSLVSCTIHARTAPQEIIPRAQNASIVLTNKVILSEQIIAQLPALRYIGVLATGYNVVDVNAARTRGIIVTNVPAYSTASVAQLVFALLLELTHHTGHHAREVRSGRWSASADFSFWDMPLAELHGRTFGIIGYGNIGSAVARIASAFGMTVLVSTRRAEPGTTIAEGVTAVDLETLFRSSDIISLHCPLTDATKQIINTHTLSLMKSTAWLINTGRGPLVDEPALAGALNNGRIAGAGLDVLSTEPPTPDNPLLTAKNCIITPHIAWASFAARTRLMETVTANVRAFLAGHPVNVVS